MANKIDLDGMSVQELTALIGDAENKRREKMDDAKAALLAEMEEKAAALGLSLDGLVQRGPSSGQGGGHGGGHDAPARTRKPRKDAGAPVAAKFRGPNGEEWSGRGRPPTWLNSLEAQGRNREQFRL